jgi:hypothetical protein
MRKLAGLCALGLMMAWPSPDLGGGWCGSDEDCEMVWGPPPDTDMDTDMESVYDYPVPEVA